MRSSSFLVQVILAVLAAILLLQSSSDGASAPMPAFLKRKKTYTPLFFFTVPKGTMDECDGMEKMIKSLEKEQNIKVQRLDIMRDRAARKLYEKLVEGNLRSPFPLLYHRESLQRVYGLADEDLVRSWSKGRLLPEDGQNLEDEKDITVLGGPEGEMMEDDMEMDMEELEMEMDAELSPMQRRGKEAMKRRMEEGRK
eukprot:CAMPEP_0183728398 /NCGR_PEP_ID=MMETSP0737-20130205/27974_1 /TAXON_ID=385413 /ORGANISM="Thalassiosira miniscula, Strain CCMP1093" /LENGTH=196 /DNA_ID=CAMNT_0025960331 /DNA_START=112 /DNA_END=702 /DNA_ORIENTATION=+